MSAPNTPTNLNLQQGNGQVYLTWSLVVGATSYSIQRSVDNITFSSVATPVVSEYLDTSVTVNTQYFYRVAGVNGDGTGAYTEAQAIIPVNTGVVSLGQLRLAAQQRADRVNSNFVTMPEWNSYINQSATELYDLLITAYEDYFLQDPPYQLTTDGNASSYALPQDFYKLMGVDLGLNNSNNARVTIDKFDFISRNRYVFPQVTSTFFGVFNMRYRVMGNKLRFIPTPSANQVITVWYIPRLPWLLKDTDTFESISGWAEYIIVDAAIKALQKEESDVTVLMAQKQMLQKRIEETATNRDAGSPDTVSSARSWGNRNGSWGGGGFDGPSGGY